MRKLIYALPVILVLCVSPVLANYSPMPDMKSIPSALPSVLLLDYTSDLFFILLSLLIMGQAGRIRFNTIMKVSFLALTAGFIADEIGIRVTTSLSSARHISTTQIITGTIVSILLIACANYIFSRRYFKLDHSRSLTLGLLVGICTMPGGVLLVENIMYSGFQRYAIHHAFFEELTGFGSRANLTTFVVVGMIFTAADIILLHLVRPVTSMSRIGIGAFGLLIAAGISLYTYISYDEYSRNEREIMACSIRMRILARVILDYEKEHGDYPSDISTIPAEMLTSVMPVPDSPSKDYDYTHCMLDEDRSGITSYEYRKPPVDFRHSEQYWMLKCTHHAKYDLYISAIGTPMKSLLKGERYK